MVVKEDKKAKQMGQKVNPIANRLGIVRGWDSNWYGGKDFSSKLVEDAKIRKYLGARLAKASISKIIIERTLKLVTVTISHGPSRHHHRQGRPGGRQAEGRAAQAHRQGGSDQYLRGKTSRAGRRDRRQQHRPPARRPYLVPPRREDRHRFDDAHGRRRHEDPDLGPRGRCRNGPQRDLSKRAVFRCTRSAPTSITRCARRSRRWVSSA